MRWWLNLLFNAAPMLKIQKCPDVLPHTLFVLRYRPWKTILLSCERAYSSKRFFYCSKTLIHCFDLKENYQHFIHSISLKLFSCNLAKNTLSCYIPLKNIYMLCFKPNTTLQNRPPVEEICQTCLKRRILAKLS